MWLLSLVLLTIAFFISSFFIEPSHVFAYRWMTLGMGIVGFVYYLIIWRGGKKENTKMLGSHIGAVVVKFILSMFVIVLYGLLFGLDHSYEFIYFFVAYLIYSIVIYTGAYTYK